MIDASLHLTGTIRWVVDFPRRAALRLLGGLGVASGFAALGALDGCGRDRSTAPKPSAGNTAAPSVPASRPPSAAPQSWATLAKTLDGSLIRPGDTGYPDAARLYNPRFDASSRPAAIARCASPADVQACVRYAADTRTPFAMRCGGHSYGGWSTSSGLVVDVSRLSSVTVQGGTARIGAGTRLVDVYAGLAAKGVAMVGGSCPTVGISGLTLGGGLGVLSRAWGLACDAVTGVQVVTADGRLREVDAATDADLFWALRGGGGSFGAVTAWTVRTRPAPTVHTFQLAWDWARAAEVLTGWQQWAARCDLGLWSTCKLLANPGQHAPTVTISGTWLGAAAGLDAQLGPLLTRTGAPTSRQTHSMSYANAMMWEAGCSGETAAQCESAALTVAKRKAFAGTSSIVESALPSAGVSAVVAQTLAGLNVSGMLQGGVAFDVLGGAVGQVAPDATAFPHRTALATMQYTATWRDSAAAPAKFDGYVRGFRAALTPWLGTAAYANYADPSIQDYGPAYWGANYPRLRQVKRAVDADELFRYPQSVRP